MEVKPENASQVRFSVSERGCRLIFPLGRDTQIFGFGLQLKAFNHRGNKLSLRVNADPRSASGDSHAPVPFFVTNEHWGMYIDTARNAVFQCGSEMNSGMKNADEDTVETKVMNSTEELYSVRTQSSSVMTVEVPVARGIDVYFITGEKIVDIVSSYNLLSGGGCMPPMWGLGNFYRCCGQFHEQQVWILPTASEKCPCPAIFSVLSRGGSRKAIPAPIVGANAFRIMKKLSKSLYQTVSR